MKLKNIYLLLLATVVIVACDPNKDIYEDIKSNPDPVVKDLVITLSEDDYELSGNEDAANSGSFYDEDEAKEGIPNILEAKYPQLGHQSSAKVTYNLFNQDQKNQFIYEVTNQDYADQGHTYGNFDSFEDITEFLDWKYPSLESYEDEPQSYTSPSKGDLVFLEYKYYDGSVSDLKDGFIYTNEGWMQASGFTRDEYNVMGEYYANFSNEDEALFKIPVYLAGSQDPYEPAMNVAGDVEAYTYAIYDDGTTYGTLVYYLFDGSTWSLIENGTPVTLQVGNVNGDWVPDNTLKYTMTSADYALVVTNYEDINATGVASMENYGNYDLRLWLTEDIQNSIADVLVKNFGSEDEGQKYLVSYQVYTGSAGETHTVHMKKEGDKYILVTE